jgi:ribosome recycling factor
MIMEGGFDVSVYKKKMDGAIKSLQADFASLRTGRASLNMLDPVKVDAYGSLVPINQVGNLGVPEPRLLTIQVWDKAMVTPICKAIINAGLGLNPQPDGSLIRIPIPELNEERRKEITKVASKYTEQARIAVRNVRRDAIDHIKKLEKDHKISEDDAKRLADDIQKLTDQHISDADSMLKQKENDIMSI